MHPKLQCHVQFRARFDFCPRPIKKLSSSHGETTFDSGAKLQRQVEPILKRHGFYVAVYIVAVVKMLDP